ncbi:MAG: hypothetical protein WBG19_09675 [Thermoplasmata archaeon]
MKYLVLLILLTPATAMSATFEHAQASFIGCHYTYEMTLNGRQIPIYFSVPNPDGQSSISTVCAKTSDSDRQAAAEEKKMKEIMTGNVTGK